MIAFAESTTCRMAALVQHFGDTTDTRATCGLCDICNPSDTGSAQTAHQPTAQERIWLREILSALDHRSTSTGKLFTDLKKDSKNWASIADRKDFDTLLDGLARAGLITLINDTFRSDEGRDITYRKAAINHEGRTPDDATLDTVWLRTTIAASPAKKKSSSKSRTQRAGAPSSPMASSSAKVGLQDPDTPSPAAEALFDQLRNWRTEIARPTKTPAFMILSDAVLRAIAARAPQNLTALHAIPGMGPTKVDRYGAALIALCRGESPTADLASPSAAATQVPRGFSLGSHGSKKEAGASAPERLSTRTSPPDHQRSTAALERPAASYQPIILTETERNRKTPKPQVPPQPIDLTPAQLALESRLKDWRREAAKAAGLPTFFIVSDTVLRAIAVTPPNTLESLAAIRGLSPDKLTQFGPTILTLCAEGKSVSDHGFDFPRPITHHAPHRSFEVAARIAAEDLRPLSTKTRRGQARSQEYNASAYERLDFEEDLRIFAQEQSTLLSEPASRLLSEAAIAEILRFRPETVAEIASLENVRGDLPASFNHALLKIINDSYNPQSPQPASSKAVNPEITV